MLTTNKITTGNFEVLWNGQTTKYRIVNLSAGMSGYGGNTYGIEDTETQRYTSVGSLQRTKKTLARWIETDELENEIKNLDVWEPLSEQEQEEKIKKELQAVRKQSYI